MCKTLALSLAAGAVIAADWLRLEQPRENAGRAAALVVLAAGAALVPRTALRAAAAGIACIAAGSLSFFASPTGLLPWHGDFVSTVASRFKDGFVDFYTFRLPIAPSVQPHMHMVLLAALFAFTLAVALAVAARRALLSVGLFVVGAGWPATLLSGGNELGRGAVIVVVTLALLAGLSERAGRFAVPASAAVAVGAVALAASPAVAKPGFLDWQHWNPYAHAPKPVSVSFVWNGRYSGIRFPRKVTTLMSIRAPKSIGTYWRATALDEYAHDRWTERLWRESPGDSRLLAPAGARNPARTVEQDVTINALADNHLVAASMPVSYNISDPATYVGQDVAVATNGLQRGQRYLAWSFAAHPSPRSLARLRASYPRALTRPGRELEIAPGVDAPPFAKPGRDELVARELSGRLEPYRALFDRARALVGATRSPYAAVVALEQWFRTTGGFTYSLHPPAAPGIPPLVAFVLRTQSGYCQHFAGAMALMTRMLGIPARVAAGFVSGTYSNGTWRVTDRDAHTWVEVWFPRYGWLPFDPTPGRGTLGGAYSASSPRFDSAAAAKLLSSLVRGGEVFGHTTPAEDRTPHRNRNLHDEARTDATGPRIGSPKSHRHSLLRFLVLLVSAATAAIVLAKTIRTRLRYLTRDPRKVAEACARELADFLADQRFSLRRGATFGELRELVADEFSVDAQTFADAADAARFGPPSSAAAAAARARDELRGLKPRLRAQLSLRDRLRGAVSLRSLGLT